MSWWAYYKTLEEEKIQRPYQSLTFKVFREILPYVENRFRWEHSRHDHTTLILYYTAPAERLGRWPTRYIVDISYGQSKRFRKYHRKYLERKEEEERQRAIEGNASMGILEDVQKVLEKEIHKNLKSVQHEAAKQQEIAQRLSPFEHDYIKTQIEVEV